MKLTAENVEKVFMDCLFKPDELDSEGKLSSDPITAEGVMARYAFQKDRLESHRYEIISALGQLPPPFKESDGGGWSFLDACMDSDEGQWGEHIHIEHLMVLGLAIGKVRMTAPCMVWNSLPGGMPYFTVLA